MQHLAVDGSDLVRQRFDTGTVYREVGIEQMCEPDALGLGGEPERVAVTVEAEGPSRLDQFEPRLGIAKEQYLSRAVGAPVHDVQSIGPYPFRAHDLDRD